MLSESNLAHSAQISLKSLFSVVFRAAVSYIQHIIPNWALFLTLISLIVSLEGFVLCVLSLTFTSELHCMLTPEFTWPRVELCVHTALNEPDFHEEVDINTPPNSCFCLVLCSICTGYDLFLVHPDYDTPKQIIFSSCFSLKQTKMQYYLHSHLLRLVKRPNIEVVDMNRR